MSEELRFSNKAGEEYDLFSLSLPHQDEIQNAVVESLVQHFSNGNREIKVLEIGFGTGITSSALLSSSEHIHLVAIDNEPAMLSRASARLKLFPNNRFELYTKDALDYLAVQESNSLDAIASVWVIHNFHYEFRTRVLKEIFRTLKPGGIFVNGDKLAVSDPSLHAEHLTWQLKQFEVYDTIDRPELRKEWSEHYIEDENPDHILFEDAFVQELAQLGFTECAAKNRNYLDAVVSASKALAGFFIYPNPILHQFLSVLQIPEHAKPISLHPDMLTMLLQ